MSKLKQQSTEVDNAAKSTMSQTSFQVFAWLLGIATVVLAVLSCPDLTQTGLPLAYRVFPVLGLSAFSLMWTHYTTGFLRSFLGFPKDTLKKYFTYTSWTVLVLICLHPGLLIFQRFQDGYGLPPHSYETFVRPGLAWVTLLGSASLLVFLAFELHRFYSKRSWWKYVLYLNDIAMLAIVYHGLRLGDDLQTGWYRMVWFFYALTLIGVLIYNYSVKFGWIPSPAPAPTKNPARS